ncbi:MAG: hypothetical protein J0I45_16290 [Bosea sp.]|nr:hypothetical protein [Bosea sp. (in: a-proteobacteria)]
MSWRFHGRANVDPDNPQAFAVCDRCGFWYNLVDLQWQYQYAGPVLQNTRFKVCRPCLDIPQPQLKPRILPPDPAPVFDPRPQFVYIDTPDEFQVLVTSADQTLVTDTGEELIAVIA